MERAAHDAERWLERHQETLIDPNLITVELRRQWQSKARALRRALREIDEALGTAYRPTQKRQDAAKQPLQLKELRRYAKQRG